MAGASREHNLIVTNLLGELRSQLKGRPCELYPSDLRVRVPATGLYTYSDVVVVCGEPRFEDEHFDTLLNPSLVIEVLFRLDRGLRPGQEVRALPGPRLASASTCSSPRTSRWSSSSCARKTAPGGSPRPAGRDAVVHLPSLGCSLAWPRSTTRFRCPDGGEADPIRWSCDRSAP